MEENLTDETLEGTGIVIDTNTPRYDPPFRLKRTPSRKRPWRLWEWLLAAPVLILAGYGGWRLADNYPAPSWVIIAVLGVVAVGFGVQAWRGRG